MLEKLSANKRAAYSVFLMLSLLLFGMSIRYGDNNIDDSILSSSLPKPEEGLKGIFSVFTKLYDQTDYRPVTVLSFAVEQYIFGAHTPSISHLINILLYVLIAIQLFRFLQLLPFKNAAVLAFITTLLFIVHPSHASMVCSLKNRDGLLSCLFAILAIKTLHQYFKDRKIYLLLLCLFYFLAGYLSKRDAAMFVLLAILTWYFFSDKENKRKDVLVFVLLFAVYILADNISWMLHVEQSPITSRTYTENPLFIYNAIAAKISMGVITFLWYIKFMIIPYGYYFYFGTGSIPDYPLSHPVILILLVFFILVTILAILRYKRNTVLSYAYFWFLLGLSYCLNVLIPVAGIVADRYSFIASAGFCLGFAYVLIRVNDRMYEKKITPISSDKTLLLLSLLILTPYALFCYSRNKDWKDDLTLIEADMPHLIHSFEANRIAVSRFITKGLNSRDTLVRNNYLRKALEYSRSYNKYDPTKMYLNETEAICLYQLNDTPNALKKLIQNIQHFDSSIISYQLLGDIQLSYKNTDSALMYYTKIIQLDSSNLLGYKTVSTTLFRSGRIKECEAFNSALNIKKPDWFLPYQNIAEAYLAYKDTSKAIEYYGYAFNKGLKDDLLLEDIIIYLQNHQQYNEVKKFQSYIGR